MRVLVTGATGFIGGRLAGRLAAAGHQVRALVRDPARAAPLAALGVELAPGDLGDPRSLAAAVDGCALVVHLAGLVKALSAADFFRVNAEGTRALARACAGARPRPRLVLVSSLAAAGPSPGRPRREEDPPAPVSRYGESKLAGEAAARELAGRLETVVLRPPAVYGPGDRELLPLLFGMARLGVILKAGWGEKRYSVLHVDDLCRAVLAAAERGKAVGRWGPEGTYFLSDGGEYRWEEIGRAAADALPARAVVVPLPELLSSAVAAAASLLSALSRRPAVLGLDKLREMRQPAWTCAIDRAVRELGFEPALPLAEGMRDAAAWWRARGRPG